MRITLVTTKLDLVGGGGSNHDRHNKALLLKERGWDVKMITIFSRNNKLKEMPYEIIEENVYYKNFFQFHKTVCDILKKYDGQTDIYYVDGHMCLFGAGLYRKGGGKKTVAHFDNYMPSVYSMNTHGLWSNFKLFLEKYFERLFLLPWYNSLDLYTFGSPVIKEEYAKFGIKENLAIILPAFIDFLVFQSTIPFLCEKREKSFHLLYVGRLIREKGLDVLLNAMQFLRDCDLVLDVVGVGPNKNQFIELSQKLHIIDRVSWYPWVEKKSVGAVYRHAQVFISPAIWREPFGMTTVEAMFFGIPVVVSSDTGPAWIVGEDAGRVFKNGNPVDLAAQIKILYNDKELRNRLSQMGSKRVEDFQADKNADLLALELRRLLEI
jgi:glycosyltransferase involved in cell wall biosynthesis